MPVGVLPLLASTTAPGGPLGRMDCEVASAGFLSQPVNAWSSLAFVLAGLWLMRTALRAAPEEARRLLAFAVLEIAIGIGSFAYHGPMGAAAPFLHDSSLLLLLLLICVVNLVDLAAMRAGPRALPRWEVTVSAGVVPVTAVTVLGPRAVNVLAAALLVGSVLLEARLGRRLRLRAERRRVAGSALLLMLGAGAYVLGRTGGPWCEPASWLQPHAAWHIFAAVALAVYARGMWGTDPGPAGRHAGR